MDPVAHERMLLLHHPVFATCLPSLTPSTPFTLFLASLHILSKHLELALRRLLMSALQVCGEMARPKASPASEAVGARLCSRKEPPPLLPQER